MHNDLFTQDVVEELSKLREEPQWLTDLRLRAFEEYVSQSPPNFRYGLNISVNTRGLDLTSLEQSHIVLPAQQLEKHSGVIVEDFQTALKNREPVMKHVFEQIVRSDKIHSLHHALWNTGTLVYVPKNTVSETPVILDSLATRFHLNNLFIVAEPASQVTVAHNTSSSPQNIYSSEFIFADVWEDAQVNFIGLQNLGKNVFNFSNRQAAVERNAVMRWYSCELGSQLTRSEISTLLKGKGAEGINHSAYFGSEQQQHDIFMSTTHDAPNTACSMITRGALTGKAKSVYRGLVKITQKAPGSDGHQKGDTLVLSDQAEADAVPYLEIDNNDVRCGHGASVGHVDKEKLFYMMSRGIDKDVATKHLVEGFFEYIVRSFPEHTRQKIQESIAKRIMV